MNDIPRGSMFIARKKAMDSLHPLTAKVKGCRMIGDSQLDEATSPHLEKGLLARCEQSCPHHCCVSYDPPCYCC